MMPSMFYTACKHRDHGISAEMREEYLRNGISSYDCPHFEKVKAWETDRTFLA